MELLCNGIESDAVITCLGDGRGGDGRGNMPINHTYSLQPHGGILLQQTSEKLYQLLGSIGGCDDDLVQGELINILHCSSRAGHKMDCA